jgi:gamma-carbonic anhydrase
LIRIGSWTNIQDRTVITEAFQPLHEDHDGSTIVGHWVTVGHGCQLRACTIEDECIVGMNSILSEGSYMEKNTILGAGSVLMPGVRVPSGELWAGNPARFIRKLTSAEIEAIVESAENYYRVSLEHSEEYFLPVGTAYQEAEKRGIPVGFQIPIPEDPEPAEHQ